MTLAHNWKFMDTNHTSLIFLPCCAQGPSTRPSHPSPIHPLFQEWALREGNVHLVRRGRGPSTAAMVVRVARAPRAKSPKRGCGDETRTDRHRLRKHRKILPLAKNLLVIFFLSMLVLLPLSLPSPFPFPFLSSGCLFGLGVGLTGVASSVSPTAPNGFVFGFFG